MNLPLISAAYQHMIWRLAWRANPRYILSVIGTGYSFDCIRGIMVGIFDTPGDTPC